MAALAILAVTAFPVNADEVDDFVVSEMAKRSIPGLQIAIIRQNEVSKIASYGSANIEDNIPVDNNTVFSINSITKAFVGVAIMQLVEQGKLDLNKPISYYLPGLPEAWHKLTIRQLMSHTSGLPSILSDNTGGLITDDGPDAAWTLVQTLPMEFETDSQFKYNQTNYVVIGKLIDKLSGQSFRDFIVDKQLKTMFMDRTIEAGFSNLNHGVKNSARRYTTYYGNGLSQIKSEFFSPMLQTAAGMSSTAAELAKWLIALQQDKLLNASSKKLLWTPSRLANGETQGFNRLLNGYALGWPVMMRAEHPAIAAVGGDRAGIFVYPEDNMSIIILTNLMGALPSQFVDEIAGLYIPQMKQANGFGLPANVKVLWKTLELNGYDEAINIADTLIEKGHLKLSENELNNWGYALIGQERVRNALEIFKLNVHLFPQSANTYDSLAETYWKLGDIKQAIAGYEKTLKLQPNNENAKRQLSKLATLLQ